MKFTPATYLAVLIAALVLPTAAVLGYNLTIDPFQIFRKDTGKPVVLMVGRGADRYQHAGIINNYPLRSIILGNSHSANFIPSRLEKVLDLTNAYTLTMDGAPVSEQSLVGRYALRKGTVSYVLWGVSYNHLMQAHDTRNKKIAFPEFLYDDSLLNDIPFFLTFDLHKYHRERVVKQNEQTAAGSPDAVERESFDRATAWYWEQENRFNRPGFVAGLICKDRPLTYAGAEVERLSPVDLKGIKQDRAVKRFVKRVLKRTEENIDKNIVSLVKANPGTRFDFVFTTYPTLKVQIQKLYRQKRYGALLHVMDLFVRKMAPYPNARVFAFGLESFADDLRLYKDDGHYHIAVNDYILEAIAGNRNRITTENITAYLTAFDQKVSGYRLPHAWNPSKIDEKTKEKGSLLTAERARELIVGFANGTSG